MHHVPTNTILHTGMACLNNQAVGTVILRSNQCLATSAQHSRAHGGWHYLQDTLILEDPLEVRRHL